MEQRTELAPRIRQFIEQNFVFIQPCALNDSDSFLENGILDSTGVLQLIAFLGEAYGITVSDEELLPENLDSVDNVAAYVGRKLTASASADGHVHVELAL